MAAARPHAHCDQDDVARSRPRSPPPAVRAATAAAAGCSFEHGRHARVMGRLERAAIHAAAHAEYAAGAAREAAAGGSIRLYLVAVGAAAASAAAALKAADIARHVLLDGAVP